MTSGKEHFHTLRQFYKQADYRRCRCKHRSNRWADILGFTPSGSHVIGFWDGSEEPAKFSPDEIEWSNLVVYV